ncbi:mannitol-1-phosphate dehydrogenase M1PDH1 [Dendrothele bispora CBS 962.96]|uniref:alcohol dehydrogenase n=1 Tax=Dendrothele bispora (strain CBS 962.96) TaxID=1314807 RepID=A0A4S8LUH8_DENBC|nr:mannitol-1-phosphate dehydrogenase M1PDH1 [Dendrothele bispora CBS 962.96]
MSSHPVAHKIPSTARAAIITEFKKPFTLSTNHPVPSPSSLRPGECLVKIEYAGCCHSDIHVRDNDWGGDSPVPLVAGHEGVGKVVAVAQFGNGEDVKYRGEEEGIRVKVGDRVGLKWFANACLRCESCRLGRETNCSVARATTHGYRVDGTFADYVVSWTDYVTPIPKAIPDSDLPMITPMLCAGVTIYKALKVCNAQPGQWVAISGAGGGLGHLGIQFAKAMGFRVVAIDTGASKKSLCLSLGADAWVDFVETGEKFVQEVQKAAGGLGPHAAVVAVGHPLPFNQAVMYLRLAGTLVAVGMPGGGGTLNVPITLMIAKTLTIVGSATGTRQDMAEVLDFVVQGKVKCIYQERKMEEVNEVMDELAAGKVSGRIVLKM